MPPDVPGDDGRRAASGRRGHRNLSGQPTLLLSRWRYTESKMFYIYFNMFVKNRFTCTFFVAADFWYSLRGHIHRVYI